MLSRISLRLPRCFAYKIAPPPPPPNEAEIKAYIEKVDYLQEVLKTDFVPRGFRLPTVLALVPLAAGAGCTALCPHFSMLLPVLPTITHSTLLYTGLIGTVYTAAYWGIAGGQLDASGETLARCKWLYVLGSLGPLCISAALIGMTVFPYSAERYAAGFATLAAVNIATLVTDVLYTRRYKMLPVWFARYKQIVSVVLLAAIVGTAYGTHRFPQLTVNPKQEYPVQTIGDIMKIP